MHIFITANSPGEISGWVRPIVEKLKEKDKRIGITLLVPPCQYASGEEIEIARRWPWIDEIVGPKVLLAYILLGWGKKKFAPAFREKSCILFLGGDPFYAAILARKLRIPAFVYTNRARWAKYFEKFLVTDRKVKEKFESQGISPRKIEIVGHLALDSIQITRRKEEVFNDLGISPGQIVISFLPGSRPVEVEFMVPFFINAIDSLREDLDNLRILFILAPFTSKKQVTRLLQDKGVELAEEDNFLRARTRGGVSLQVVRKRQHEAISISDLVVTVPGTNNLQIAGMGIPMLVVLPLNRAELIPVDGLLGLINPRIPPIGLIKRHLIFRKNKKLKFISLPNIMVGSEIVPELRGIIEPEDIAREALTILRNPSCREKMSAELRKTTEGKGAVENIVNLILNT